MWYDAGVGLIEKIRELPCNQGGKDHLLLLPGSEACLHGEGAESPYTIHRSSRSGGGLGIVPVLCAECPDLSSLLFNNAMLPEEEVDKRLTKGGIEVEE